MLSLGPGSRDQVLDIVAGLEVARAGDVDPGVSPVMSKTVKSEVGLALDPRRDLARIGQGRVVFGEPLEVDRVLQRELYDPVMKLQAALALAGVTGLVGVVAFGGCDVGFPIGFEGWIVRVLFSGIVVGVVDEISVGLLLLVRGLRFLFHPYDQGGYGDGEAD